ncbi:MAG: T9SS type A sorting domain-containing protein, partial [Flavobacteriales bacterium]|nr:T9SS type A sorting domain-containing protein [Flavobacteriales bacterium]
LEQQRNDRIEIVQGNRNPFIDYESLAYDAWLWEEDLCSVFETEPVDLTKSFQPVPYPNGVIDRVQVKWYKQYPEVKYAPEDNAACDIQFWPIRDLVLNIPIVNADTSLIPQRTKPGQDFFKWPIKFQRPDVYPNIRYNWRVRCACDEGAGLMSPWSAIKIFNTPDFDPNTNIYTPPENIDFENNDEFKSLNSGQLRLYPNPVDESLILQSQTSGLQWSIFDLTGRLMLSGNTTSEQMVLDVGILDPGHYIFRVESTGLTEFLLVN